MFGLKDVLLGQGAGLSSGRLNAKGEWRGACR